MSNTFTVNDIKLAKKLLSKGFKVASVSYFVSCGEPVFTFFKAKK